MPSCAVTFNPRAAVGKPETIVQQPRKPMSRNSLLEMTRSAIAAAGSVNSLDRSKSSLTGLDLRSYGDKVGMSTVSFEPVSSCPPVSSDITMMQFILLLRPPACKCKRASRWRATLVSAPRTSPA